MGEIVLRAPSPALNSCAVLDNHGTPSRRYHGPPSGLSASIARPPSSAERNAMNAFARGRPTASWRQRASAAVLAAYGCDRNTRRAPAGTVGGVTTGWWPYSTHTRCPPLAQLVAPASRNPAPAWAAEPVEPKLNS